MRECCVLHTQESCYKDLKKTNKHKTSITFSVVLKKKVNTRLVNKVKMTF